MNFTPQDIAQIEAKGLTVKAVESQINTFKKGIPFTTIKAAATIGNGILKLKTANISNYVTLFDTQKQTLSLLKFVPASGAATRMFKFLFEFLETYNSDKDSIDASLNNSSVNPLSVFIKGIEKLPFYNQVIASLTNSGIQFNTLSQSEKLWCFANRMLSETELNFGNFPKGLLPFHNYKNNHIATAFEEHLYEAAAYATVKNTANVHFTISKHHETKFASEFERIKQHITKNTGVNFNITFSYQQNSTDTIAVTSDNTPFRNENKVLLFRPSGHGALLKNLNALNADIIFIKNIDNVVVKKHIDKLADYKKALAGLLLSIQNETFEFLNRIETKTIKTEDLTQILEFLTKKLNVKVSNDFDNYSEADKIEYLKEKLNRPIRVCGMVKNEGEPGGGPFWVQDAQGVISLQIVEAAQINTAIPSQKQALEQATHFNPVDLVCGTRNYKGEAFDLETFANYNAAFISSKTYLGKPIKALELPGLWNGSMAYWNTIFVEVPMATFNPVKTVNDLLKHSHQNNTL